MPLLHVFVLRFQLRKNRYDTAKVLKKTQKHLSVNIMVKKKYFWDFYLTISKCLFYSNIQPKTRHISISNNSEHLLNTIIPPTPTPYLSGLIYVNCRRAARAAHANNIYNTPAPQMSHDANKAPALCPKRQKGIERKPATKKRET